MSVFQKEDTKANGSTKDSPEVMKTGGEVDAIVSAFLPHSHDRDEGVRGAYTFALVDMGNKQPALLLSSISTFLSKNPKLDLPHRIQLITSLEKIIAMKREDVNESLADQLIRFLVREMIKDQDPVNELAQPCSASLVLLSVPYAPVVLDQLLLFFKHGEVPHYYLIKTLSDVATANGIQFTLRLTDILTRTTPCLGNIKKAPMKWVFATALGHYAEALQHFLLNANDDLKASVNSKTFELEFLTAFDMLFQKWLIESPEAKVRFSIIESLGYMSSCLERTAFESRLPKVIPKFLEMYKKEKIQDHLPITQGLYWIVNEAAKNKEAIEPLLPALLKELHPLLCKPVDTTIPTASKNHNEMLRIMEILARVEVDMTLNFIVNRFQLKEKETRIGSLIILRHLVNSMDPLLMDKRPLIMTSVITMVNEHDLNVKKAMMQLIVSMSNQNYLSMEGGQALIKFILQQSALAVDEHEKSESSGKDSHHKHDKDHASPLQIRNAANHILLVMATKVPSSRQVMWPYLLELVNDEAFNRAILIIFKCIEAIANMKREEKAADYLIDFIDRQDIPRPQAIFARLMCLAAEPYRQKDMGVTICKSMLGLGPIIHPDISAYWDEAVPALLEYLESHPSDTLLVSKWQDTLLKVWRESLNRITESKWLHETAEYLGVQFKLYKAHGGINDASIHRQIHRYMGAVLARVDSKPVVDKSLELQWHTINHRSDTERLGFAQGMGLAAYTHIDSVLGKLSDRIGKTKEQKKGFFSFSKDEGIGDELQISTIILSYGYIAAYAQTDLILSRLDVYILHNMIPVMLKARTHLFRVTSIVTIDLIGQAVHISRLPEGKLNFKLSQRDELMNNLIIYCDDKARREYRVSSDIRALGLKTMSTLIQLSPVLNSELRNKLLLAVLPYFALTDQFLTEHNSEKKGEEKEMIVVLDKREEYTVDTILTNLNTVCSSIVSRDPALSTTLDILKLLEPYLVSTKLIERQRASRTFYVVLKQFITVCIGDTAVPHSEKSIPALGSYLAMVLPRTLDSDTEVRTVNVENVQALLYIEQLLDNPDNPKPSQSVKMITDIKSRVGEKAIQADRLLAAADLAAIIVSLLSVTEVVRILSGLFSSFLDSDSEAAHGGSYIFYCLIEHQGKEMATDLKMLISGILTSSRTVKQQEVLDNNYKALRYLTELHFDPILAQLSEAVVPLPKEHIECFTALVNDPERPTLTVRVVQHLCETINSTPIDKAKPNPIVATSTAALKEVCKVSTIKDTIVNEYPALFCTVCLRIGMSNVVDNHSTIPDSIAALKQFLLLEEETAVLADCDKEDVWKLLTSNTYDDGITFITRSFSVNHGNFKAPVLAYLAKFFNPQSYIGQRIVATAMLAEFVTHSNDDNQLLKDVIKFLLPRVADKVEKVRKHALRGLGNLVMVWNEETAEMATSILSSLISASEDSDTEVAAEAVASLTRIVGVVSETTIAPMLISICFRIRPAFDRKEDLVRAAAFTLFGGLCRFGKSTAADEAHFMEQVHISLPIFIVHMNDEDSKVRKAVHTGLKQIATLLDSTIPPIIEETQPEPAAYDDMIYKVTPILAQVYPDQVRGYIDNSSVYFNSRWVSLHGASALFAAQLLAHSKESVRKGITVSAVITALIKLLDEPNAGVRTKAVKGLSHLYDI